MKMKEPSPTMLGGISTWIGPVTLSVAVVVGTLVTMAWQQYRACVQRKRRRPIDDVPYVVPNPHWLLGHLPLMGQGVHDGLKRLVVDHAGGGAGISTFFNFNKPVFTALDAALAAKILKFTSQRNNNPLIARHFQKMFGQHSLIMMNGKEWKSNREILQRAFRPEVLPQVQEQLLQAATRTAASVAAYVQSQPLGILTTDALTICRMACLDVFGLAAFGYDFGCTANQTLKESPIFQSFNFMQQELTRRCFRDQFSFSAQLYSLPNAANRKLAQEQDLVRSVLKSMVQARRREMQEASACTHYDLLASVLEGSNGQDDSSDDYLSDWLMTAMFGGYETSSIGIANTIYYLAKYPDFQQSCFEEATRVLAKQDLMPSNESKFDSACDLPLINACVLEALRLLPPVAMLPRSLHRPLQLEVDGEKMTLPSGTRCVFSTYWVHHSSRNFERPEEFLPERWAYKENDSNVWQKRSDQEHNADIPCGKHEAFLSFSTGARNCVGLPLAVRMLPTVIATLIRKLNFELVDSAYTIRLERSGANQVPNGGIPVHIKLRA